MVPISNWAIGQIDAIVEIMNLMKDFLDRDDKYITHRFNQITHSYCFQIHKEVVMDDGWLIHPLPIIAECWPPSLLTEAEKRATGRSPYEIKTTAASTGSSFVKVNSKLRGKTMYHLHFGSTEDDLILTMNLEPVPFVQGRLLWNLMPLKHEDDFFKTDFTKRLRLFSCHA